jgi:hypothetical protein
MTPTSLTELSESARYTRSASREKLNHADQFASCGYLIGRLLRMEREYDAFMDDPITISSSCGEEFASSVIRSIRTRQLAFLKEEQIDIGALEDEVISRTTGKFCYMYGILHVLGDLAEEQML